MTSFLHDGDFSGRTLVFFAVALTIALGFEFINGFHDTANAVATVIYTRSLRPGQAVIWSGLCNFLGVLLGGFGVAFSIVYLLPVDLLITIGSGSGMAMVLALLTAAILWNFGTWYLAIPASSSHTLIGSILGVGLASALLSGKSFASGVNWNKARDVGLSLLIAPVLGFVLSYFMLRLFKVLVPKAAIHQPPTNDSPPPWYMRSVLLLTCTGVSFAHGSNDGQKGIGLIMLILIGLLPNQYALNLHYGRNEIRGTVLVAEELESLLRRQAPADEQAHLAPLLAQLAQVRATIDGRQDFREVSPEDRWQLRTDILQLNDELAKLHLAAPKSLSQEDWASVDRLRLRLRGAPDYAPTWVMAAVALALGIGTTVGWHRIVVTVGEKIGKKHMTYAQGAAAELVAMSAIGWADIYGLPVSTTHVLASGVAGTMAADQSGVQLATVRNLALAWTLTLPATMLLSGFLFVIFRAFAS
ncbi:MAG TPA: anion permease [Gemmataceae bacterium]|nr:anion permease [Gemmataceae bacterium]